MSEPITKELRKYIADFPVIGNFGEERRKTYLRSLCSVADHIDEAHDNLTFKEYAHGVADEKDHILGLSNEELENGCGLVRLPVDADGEPIRCGESVIYSECTYKVKHMNLYYDGWMVAIGRGFEVDPEKIHHYKPTPAKRIREILDNLDYDDTVKEQPEPLLTIEERDALYAIADELEKAK